MSTAAFKARIRPKRNPATGAPEVTLWGEKKRVKIHIYDLTQSPIEHCRSDPITFTVCTLPASAHPSTAFYRGRQIYHGEDAFDALEKAMFAFGWELHPVEDFPAWLAKYWRES